MLPKSLFIIALGLLAQFVLLSIGVGEALAGKEQQFILGERIQNSQLLHHFHMARFIAYYVYYPTCTCESISKS